MPTPGNRISLFWRLSSLQSSFSKLKMRLRSVQVPLSVEHELRPVRGVQLLRVYFYTSLMSSMGIVCPVLLLCTRTSSRSAHAGSPATCCRAHRTSRARSRLRPTHACSAGGDPPRSSSRAARPSDSDAPSLFHNRTSPRRSSPRAEQILRVPRINYCTPRRNCTIYTHLRLSIYCLE